MIWKSFHRAFMACIENRLGAESSHSQFYFKMTKRVYYAGKEEIMKLFAAQQICYKFLDLKCFKKHQALKTWLMRVKWCLMLILE